jgi:Holliday junction resolvase RusA-like endonuclease
VSTALFRFTILGEAASKANQRKLVTINDRPAFVKSDKARKFERDALLQIPVAARVRLTGPVRITLRMFYASERPDLDEAVVLDVLQDRWKRSNPSNPIVPSVRVLVQAGVYRNDRQVREKHVFHAIDRLRPRVEVEVEALTAQQPDLLDEVEDADALPF